jgi:metallo-beta-lactamase family protein
LLVTNCQIDHVKLIPYFLVASFIGLIYATKATALLLPLVIGDVIKVDVTRNYSIIRPVMTRFKSQLVPIEYGELLNVEGFDHFAVGDSVKTYILKQSSK